MNPLLLIKFGPYVVIALLVAAWGVQTARLSSSKLELANYRIEQQEIVQRQIDVANKQRKDASDAYKAQSQQLALSIKAGDVLKRCVAAGKCGVQQQPRDCTGIRLSASISPDAASAQPVPLAGNDAAINDCAVTTLQLNTLQADIEKQPNY
ncbi:hypothetical protein [Propionivibrio sp.]|uniref:hypothetical protein n=1 Tax=Propionivibrio sp. TaxID=2212460 RepID=UPI003BF3C808